MQRSAQLGCCRNSVSGDSARALLSNRSAEDESDAALAKDLPISETNEMSLFFAHATPMLNALSAVVTNHVKVFIQIIVIRAEGRLQ